jgi:hypothetical protein
VLFAAFWRGFEFFGDRTCAATVVFWRDAARVERVVGAAGLAAAGAFSFEAVALTRFLGTSSSAFSLSSLEISSLPRFLVRVAVAVCFGAGFAAAGFCLGAVVFVVVVAGAARVLRVAGAGAGADAFFAAAVFVDVALVLAGLGAGARGARSSTSGIWRLVAGMRLTRRSRRERRLAAWASIIARSLSTRASTVRRS